MILVFAFLSFVAVGFFGGALWCVLKTGIFLRAAQKTEGVVIANTVAKDSDGGTTYVPIVAFVTEGDARIEITGRIGANPPAYQVGARVRVGYLPKRLQEAKILTFFNLYWLPLMFLVFSAVTAFSATVFLFCEVH